MQFPPQDLLETEISSEMIRQSSRTRKRRDISNAGNVEDKLLAGVSLST